ncbi:MAG: OsmC family protein [Leptospiraceae bacterium]|nr:OsmC family protein [Leptospiraceae bacterium]
MSEHNITIEWKNTKSDFIYESYERTYKVFYEGGQTILGSSTKATFGDDQYANPEELLASAVSSCHMLTFLAVASKKKKNVLEYIDNATAVLEKGESGKLVVTKVFLRPKVKLEGEITKEELDKIHEAAHRNCFIGLSIKSEVIIEPDYSFSGL